MKHPLQTCLICGPAGLLLAGCQSTHAPTVDVLGSYFPAWIICTVTGLWLTAMTRQILTGLKISPYLRPAPVIYLGLILGYTLAVWLLWFKN